MLEKRFASFITRNLAPAVECALYMISISSSLTGSSYSKKQCQANRSQPSHHCDGLCNHPADEVVSIPKNWKHSLCRVIDTKLGSSVDDNTLHRHIKALVQALYPIRFVDLNQAVTEAFEFPFSFSSAHISCWMGKIKRIHKTQ